MPLRNLDLDLLRAFVAIADCGGFTRAATLLGRTQSTVSLQIKRLEEALGGRALLRRGPRFVQLTADGRTLLDHARRLLQLNDATIAALLEPEVAGRVRLGVPEDFATAHLPRVLAGFVEAHPLVELEVRCDLTLHLEAGLRAGEFDLVLVKREPGVAADGPRVWREPLVWVARPGAAPPGEGPLPLVVSPDPCVYRKRAIRALDEQRRPWRIAYTSTSLAGAQAAVAAGLGVAVLPREMCPAGLQPLGRDAGLPALDDTEIALVESADASPTARLFAQHIAAALEADV